MYEAEQKLIEFQILNYNGLWPGGRHGKIYILCSPSYKMQPFCDKLQLKLNKLYRHALYIH